MIIKKLMIVIMVLFFPVLVYAEINILNQVNDFYNINEKIPLNLVLTNEQEISAFVKANIECKNRTLDYYVTPFTLKPSKQELNVPKLTLTKSMIGKCSLSIEINDIENNLVDRKVVKVFEINDLLILNYELNKNEFSPEDKLKISGTVKNIRGEEIESGEVIIKIDNLSFSSNLINSKFEFTYDIPSDIKSKNHKVIVNFEDNYENKASKELSFYVNPEPTSLKNLLNKIEFKPGETVEVEALLYDQANDLIENNALIKIYNPKGKLVKEGNFKLSYILEKDALPGTWIIRTSTDDFKIESKFNVTEFRDINFYIEDSVLYIENTGNVEFEDVAEIKVGDSSFSKKVGVDPGETTAFDLSNKIEEGKYDVNIGLGDKEKEFKDVEVPQSPTLLIGSAVKKLGDLVIEKPYLLLILIVIIIFYVHLKHKVDRDKRLSREKEIQKAISKTQELKREKEAKKFKPKRFSEMTEEELRDYRKQILKDKEKSGDKDSFGFSK